jgi:hypothetical protein
MALNEGGDHLDHRVVILARLKRDPTEGVDTTYPDLELWMSELINGGGEALRDLALAVQSERPRGVERPQHEDQPAQKLKCRRPDVCSGAGLTNRGEAVRLPT